VGTDIAGYIGSSEAFHGNVVSAYIKSASSPPNTLSEITWKRIVLEDFGPLNKEHTGSSIKLFAQM
jgi:aldos-2-ulose dehydratase